MRIDEIFGKSKNVLAKHKDGSKITLSEVGNLYDIESKYGKVSGYTKNDALVITSSHVFQENNRGQGFGTDLYQAMAKIAFSLDKVMVSDRNVTLSAARAWRSLAKRGIPVIENFVPESDMIGGGGASTTGMNPFIALPPGKEDLDYAHALSLLFPKSMRLSLLNHLEEINRGSKRL